MQNVPREQNYCFMICVLFLLSENEKKKSGRFTMVRRVRQSQASFLSCFDCRADRALRMAAAKRDGLLHAESGLVLAAGGLAIWR